MAIKTQHLVFSLENYFINVYNFGYKYINIYLLGIAGLIKSQVESLKVSDGECGPM